MRVAPSQQAPAVGNLVSLDCLCRSRPEFFKGDSRNGESKATERKAKRPTRARAKANKAIEEIVIEDGDADALIGKPVPKGHGSQTHFVGYYEPDISLMLAGAAMNRPSDVASGSLLADDKKAPKRHKGGRPLMWEKLLKVNDELRKKNPQITDKEIVKTYNTRYPNRPATVDQLRCVGIPVSVVIAERKKTLRETVRVTSPIRGRRKRFPKFFRPMPCRAGCRFADG